MCYQKKTTKDMFVSFLNDNKLEPDIICLRNACCIGLIPIVEEIIDNYFIDIDKESARILYFSKHKDIIAKAIKKMLGHKKE